MEDTISDDTIVETGSPTSNILKPTDYVEVRDTTICTLTRELEKTHEFTKELILLNQQLREENEKLKKQNGNLKDEIRGFLVDKDDFQKAMFLLRQRISSVVDEISQSQMQSRTTRRQSRRSVNGKEIELQLIKYRVTMLEQQNQQLQTKSKNKGKENQNQNSNSKIDLQKLQQQVKEAQDRNQKHQEALNQLKLQNVMMDNQMSRINTSRLHEIDKTDPLLLRADATASRIMPIHSNIKK